MKTNSLQLVVGILPAIGCFILLGIGIVIKIYSFYIVRFPMYQEHWLFEINLIFEVD